MGLSRVVLPAPRKPVNMVVGISAIKLNDHKSACTIGAPSLDGEFDIMASKAFFQCFLQCTLQLPVQHRLALRRSRYGCADQPHIIIIVETKYLCAKGTFEMPVPVLRRLVAGLRRLVRLHLLGSGAVAKHAIIAG